MEKRAIIFQRCYQQCLTFGWVVNIVINSGEARSFSENYGTTTPKITPRWKIMLWLAINMACVTIRPVKNVPKPGMVTVVRADLWDKEETWSYGVIYLSSFCSTAQLALHHGPWNSLTQVQTSICWYFLTPEVIFASISISVYKYTCFLSPECKVCPRIGVPSP